jgi:hypothetical protein
VAEGARLESVFRGNSNLGSNPSLSATKKVQTLPMTSGLLLSRVGVKATTSICSGVRRTADAFFQKANHGGEISFVCAAEPVTAGGKYEMSAIRSPLAIPLVGIGWPIEREWVNIAPICVHFEDPLHGEAQKSTGGGY